jgi:hypothetical protein
VSIPAIVVVSLQWASVAAYLIVTLAGVQNWLQFVTYLSYMKVAASTMKYIPQARFYLWARFHFDSLIAVCLGLFQL